MEDLVKSFTTIPHNGDRKVSLTKLVSFGEGNINEGNTSLPINGKIASCQYLFPVKIKKSNQLGAPNSQIFRFFHIHVIVHFFQMINGDR
jgi:hypothetical protein